MKVSNTDEIRISILMALAISEIVGLLHFYRQPMFAQFVIHSLAGILLIIPLLWIEYIQRRGISYFSVLFSIGVCTGMTASWNEGSSIEHLFVRPLIVGLPILVTTKLLRKLLRPIDIDQQETFLNTIRDEDVRAARVAGNTVGLLACIFLTAFMGPGRASLLWAIPLVIPAAWFAWRLILHLFIKRESRNEANVFIERTTEQGGRA
jgi:fumarate reductase subunit C